MNHPSEPRDVFTGRHARLIQVNLNWLAQARALLSGMRDSTYTHAPKGLEPHRVGSHMRHILEFYECFLDGIAGAQVDYDARRRDALIEQNRQVAMARIEAIAESLERWTELRHDRPVRVRMEDSEAICPEDPYLESSVCRELGVLSSHTIHHFALIAVTLRAQGLPVDHQFGVAPSTLRYWAGQGVC